MLFKYRLLTQNTVYWLIYFIMEQFEIDENLQESLQSKNENNHLQVFLTYTFA